MKYLILLVTLFLVTSYTLAQNSLNPNVINGFNFSSTFIDKDYLQNNFLRGWNWGGSDSFTKNLDKSLKINSYHSFTFWWTDMYQENFNSNFCTLTSLLNTSGSRKGICTTTGLGIYLEPALTVEPSSTFVPNIEADQGAVFGFLNKSSGTNTVISEGSSTFGCFSLSKNSTTGTILSNIWKADILKYGNYWVNGLESIDQEEPLKLVDKNGVNWEFSINLRSAETFSNTMSDDEVILRIRLPYTRINHFNLLQNDPYYWDPVLSSNTFSYSNDYINFNSMPQLTSGTISSDILPIYGSNTFGGSITSDYRGISRKTSNSYSGDMTQLIITKGMLKTAQSNNSNSFITLRAEFICDNKVTAGIFENNPSFAPLGRPILYPWRGYSGSISDIMRQSSSFISSIDVEVEYSGKLDLDINWIRIGTPNLRKLVNGEYDDLFLAELNKISYYKYRNSAFNTANAKIARFYSNDEMDPFEWEGFRYTNLLLNSMVTSEVFLNPDALILPHFYYSTGINELWNGVTQAQYKSAVSPYVRLTNGNDKPNTFGLWEGYATYLERSHSSNTITEAYIDKMLLDTSKSLYETIYHTYSSGVNTHLTPFSTSFSEILNFLTNPHYSVQQRNELILLQTIYDQPYAFYEKPYISNVWVECTPFLSSDVFTGYSKIQTKIIIDRHEKRPKTGEEQRYAFWSELIKGSKGLIVWAKPSHPLNSTFTYYDENENAHLSPEGSFEYAGLIGRRIYSSSSTFSEEEMIYSDAVGGDFIQLTNDPYGYDKFYTPYSSTFYDYKTMNIKKDRMYIGMKSARAELKKVFDWTKSVEPTLLKLNLIAYKNKGYVSFSNSKTISQTIDKFIDTANIRTRPLGRTSATTTGGITKYIPFYENQGCYPSDTFTYGSLASTPIDSAFYEVSILKNSGSSTENEFYIGIQNRRTDPLLTFSETITTPSGNTFDNSMKFYTTAELDKMASSTAPSYSYNTSSSITGTVGSGTVTSIVNGYSRTYTSPYPPEFWQQQWWQRLGCREIRIPINITGLSNTNTMTMLKVTELGVGESIANEWWWDSKYRHNVDTAIYKDRDLVVRMLPGEGKILKVEVVRLGEGETIVGNLDYSNQSKIVSFSSNTFMTMSDRSNPNEVRYHMVYQNSPSYPINNTIYYRRSKPMTKDIAGYTTAIDWEDEEYPLGTELIDYADNTTTSSNTSNTFIREGTCFHPNIVVRVDSTNINSPTPKVYVVYSCYGVSGQSQNSKNLVIAESIFNANDETQIIPTRGRVIARAASTGHDHPNDYGVTAINASYEGNYYAWNDINLGIVAGFKKPGDDFLRATLQVTNNCSNSFPLNAHFNPSMNTYSRIPYYDVDASLVWSANSSSMGGSRQPGGFGQSRIAYTRLWYDNNTNTLINKLGSNTCGWEQSETFERYSCDEDIYYFSKLHFIHSQKFPVVYRNVEFFNSATSTYYDPYRANKNDHVYWQGNDWDSKSVIFHSTISNWDINPSGTFYNQPDCIGAIYSAHIRHTLVNLSSPTAAQGTLRRSNNEFFADADPRDPWGFEARTNDLDFVSSEFSSTLSNSIWHIPHGWQSLWMGWTYLLGNFDNFPLSMKTNTLNVSLPHLSKQMTFSTDQEKKFNRRIYNAEYNGYLQKISSSLEFFFKDNIDENAQSGIGFFGFDNSKERSYFSGVNLIRNGQTEILRINFLKDTDKGKVIEDTITTNWFSISNNDEINFIINNNDNNDKFKFYLQRKSDNKLIKLVKFSTKSDLFKQGLIFKSDTTDTYRLIWFDSNLKTFTQELLLGNKAVMMKKERANPDFVTFIDLRNGTQIDSKSEEDLLLSIYPNPATNKFSIYTGLNRSMANQSRCKVEIKVINQLGLVLMSKIVPLGEVVVYDSENLASGQYFVQVEMSEGFDGSCEHIMNVKPVSIVK